MWREKGQRHARGSRVSNNVCGGRSSNGQAGRRREWCHRRTEVEGAVVHGWSDSRGNACGGSKGGGDSECVRGGSRDGGVWRGKQQ